ncbi:hypothetical protein [Paenibacillus sp. tmac-D7]|uniref:hypothetical protein n=1 Tax=Paenibacillus sp. tmac-D7 TaxID=2591462 RepID=UPI001144DDCC|nr:hypothetical protein [Paenibacillus sp. tmac-D7]
MFTAVSQIQYNDYISKQKGVNTSSEQVLHLILDEMREIKSDVKQVRSELADVRSEVTEVRAEVTGIRSELAEELLSHTPKRNKVCFAGTMRVSKPYWRDSFFKPYSFRSSSYFMMMAKSPYHDLEQEKKPPLAPIMQPRKTSCV